DSAPGRNVGADHGQSAPARCAASFPVRGGRGGPGPRLRGKQLGRGDECRPRDEDPDHSAGRQTFGDIFHPLLCAAASVRARAGSGPGPSTVAARRALDGRDAAAHCLTGKGALMADARKVRILVAKPGLDGHDRGAKIIARALRDEGFEVIYTGLHQTPEMIVAAAVQEDVDAVGLSIMSGAHMTLFPAVIDLLKKQGAQDVVVFGGGIIPDADIGPLKGMGVAEHFTPGATTRAIAEWVRGNVRPRG